MDVSVVMVRRNESGRDCHVRLERLFAHRFSALTHQSVTIRRRREKPRHG